MEKESCRIEGNLQEEEQRIEVHMEEDENRNEGVTMEIEGVQTECVADEYDDGGDDEDKDEADIDVTSSLVGRRKRRLENMYNLYCKHALAVGFCERKSTKRRSVKHQRITEKYYLCSKQGERCNKKKLEIDDVCSSEQNQKRKVAERRTCCEAQLRVKLINGKYEVVEHVLMHNHELTRPTLRHLHRSARKFTENKEEVIQEMYESGLSASDQFNLLSYQYGGRKFVGHTRKDHYNLVYKLKMKEIENGDAQTLLNYLEFRKANEPNFFYKVKRDDTTKRLVAIYLRDAKMKEDYGVFGDVVGFDTKHRTNKYNFICAPFVGVNNHWGTVMFGCAFLSDEKTESFEWLFEAFKESMGEKNPTTIFTDQDQAISSAINKIFRGTRHRLCLWHLRKNVVSYFGLLKQDESFKDTFRKCLMGCYNEQEFEDTWHAVIEKYELEDNYWFSRLYHIREKWCTTLSKDFFSTGIISSQRSETANSAIGFKTSKTTTLTDFYKRREREEDMDFDCSEGNPLKTLPDNNLLKHAAEVYTITLYEDFQKEWGAAMSSYSKFMDMIANAILYQVARSESYKHSHIVTFQPCEVSFSCSCRNFEETGWLCFHIIRIMSINSIYKIPEKYICKRWTKLAKAKLWEKHEQEDQAQPEEMLAATWKRSMISKYFKLVKMCSTSEVAQKVVENGYKRDLESVVKIMKQQQSVGCEVGQSEHEPNTIEVLDPKVVKTKG